MAETKTFSELYEDYRAAGLGRIAWLTQNRRSTRDEEGLGWKSGEICEAMNRGTRAEQKWRAGEAEPDDIEILLDLFFGKGSLDPRREELRLAAIRQRKSRKEERRTSKAPRWNIKKQGSPYLGLCTFSHAESAVFFGRTSQIRILTDKVLANRFVAVVGASGAGKSSLVWAGLLPNLMRLPVHEKRKTKWIWTRFTPGGTAHDPVRKFVDSLTRGDTDPPLLKDPFWEVESELVGGKKRVVALVDRIVSSGKGRARFLVFIDQFEELFDQSIPLERQTALLDIIKSLITIDAVKVVVTIRHDFIPRCLDSPNFPDIAEWFSTSHWLASPTEIGVREMISGPERVSDINFEDGLIDQIVKDTGAGSGNMPLMAFALRRLFEESGHSGKMTWNAYRKFGGVHGAIGDIASEAYKSVFANYGDETKSALFALFRLLVDVDEDSGAPVRRVCSLEHIPQNPIIGELIEKFTESRLLVKTAPIDGLDVIGKKTADTTIEVAHEALFWRWQMLSRWVDQHKGAYLTRRQLVREAAEWNSLGRPEHRRWKDERAIEAAAALETLSEKITDLHKDFLGPISFDECVKLIDSGGTLSHRERLTIGIRLEILDDRRRGVGLRQDGLPDIDWCSIPEGKVAIDEMPSMFTVAPFHISKFTITVRQWDAFVSSDDGYNCVNWWHDLPRGYETPGQQVRGGGHPAVNILWSEATAFCRWLSARTGELIRLPTECEWQWAASGGDATRFYPWGDAWNPALANNEDSKLGTTVAVGLYPEGRSQFGPEDMMGNVWEWCLNDRDSIDKSNPDQFNNKAPRGGSYGTTKSECNLFRRGNYDIGYRNSNTGFRVVRQILPR